MFGVDPEVWPESLWYRLASLMANLPQLACSEEGCAFVLGVLLDLPMEGFTYRPSLAAMPSSVISRLSERASRLGVDLLLGDTIEDLAATVLVVGPVSLESYEFFVESEEGAGLLRQVLELVMPLSTAYDVSWRVQDPSRPPQLGVPARNGRLGVNSYMGTALPIVQEATLAPGPTPLDGMPGVLRMIGSVA